MEPRCWEYFEGQWHPDPPGEIEAWAYVVYATEPSPETGHVGWCWWAQGRMGDAATLGEAKAKAEAVLRLVMGDEG